MDKLTNIERSLLMSRVGSKDSRAELLVRSMIHSMGYRYRLHCKALAGTPDLVFASLRKIVFVHGCFWHGHSCRAGRNRPASNRNYWIAKLDRNMKRDKTVTRRLRREGWSVVSVWECQTREPNRLQNRLQSFLGAR